MTERNFAPIGTLVPAADGFAAARRRAVAFCTVTATTAAPKATATAWYGIHYPAMHGHRRPEPDPSQ
jgi:hypothetical protein